MAKCIRMPITLTCSIFSAHKYVLIEITINYMFASYLVVLEITLRYDVLSTHFITCVGTQEEWEFAFPSRFEFNRI